MSVRGIAKNRSINLHVRSSGRTPVHRNQNQTTWPPILLDGRLTHAVCCEGNCLGETKAWEYFASPEIAYFGLLIGFAVIGLEETALIVTKGLSKTYGSFFALRNLSLAVRQGEVFGLLGPNGSGKTTTIRLLLGLLRPTAGDAVVVGFDCWRQS